MELTVNDDTGTNEADEICMNEVTLSDETSSSTVQNRQALLDISLNIANNIVVSD